MYQFLIAWDKLKLEKLNARLATVKTKLVGYNAASQQITDEIQQGIAHFDSYGNQLVDGEDLYHCTIAALNRLKLQLETDITFIEASIACTQRTLDEKWAKA